MYATIEDAIEALAKRAAYRAESPATPAEKRAFSGADLLGGTGRFLQDNPTLAKTLIGGLAGAGVGGLGTYGLNRGKDEKDRRSPLSGALTGGLAGAAIGGGLGLASRGAEGIRSPGAHASVPPSAFYEPGIGTGQISPEAVRNNPGLVGRVRELTGGPATITSGVTAGLGHAWNAAVPDLPDLPISRTVLPPLALADFATSRNRLRLGERIGVGRIRPQFSNEPLDLQAGVAGNKDLPQDLRSAIAGNTYGTATRLAAGNLAPRGGGGNFFTRLINKIRPASVHPDTVVGGSSPPFTAQARERAMDTGYAARETARGYEPPRDLYRIGSKQFQTGGWGKALAGRAALYGAIPALEILMSNISQNRASQAQLRDLIARSTPRSQ